MQREAEHVVEIGVSSCKLVGLPVAWGRSR